MYKNRSHQIIKCFSLVFLLTHFAHIAYGSISNVDKLDPLTMKWGRQSNVQNAVKQLTKAYLELELYVQKIYNAYAPHTIGEGKLMRDRMKRLEHLVELAGRVESIYLVYRDSPEARVSYIDNIESLKKNLKFYYFDQELRLINIESNVIRQLVFSLEALCNPKWHPDFVKATKFDKAEAIRIITQVEDAIHAAVATILGGSTILQYHNR